MHIHTFGVENDEDRASEPVHKVLTIINSHGFVLTHLVKVPMCVCPSSLESHTIHQDC